jgi:hypothetical protein
MAKRGKVVHCKREFYDIYVGRGPQGEPTTWGNPFIIGRDGTREEVIKKYRDYVLNSPELMAKLPELEGKILACWCAPLACHADILVDLANKPDWGNEDLFWYGEKPDHEEKDDGLGYCVHCHAPTRRDGEVSS